MHRADEPLARGQPGPWPRSLARACGRVVVDRTSGRGRSRPSSPATPALPSSHDGDGTAAADPAVAGWRRSSSTAGQQGGQCRVGQPGAGVARRRRRRAGRRGSDRRTGGSPPPARWRRMSGHLTSSSRAEPPRSRRGQRAGGGSIDRVGGEQAFQRRGHGGREVGRRARARRRGWRRCGRSRAGLRCSMRENLHAGGEALQHLVEAHERSRPGPSVRPNAARRAGRTRSISSRERSERSARRRPARQARRAAPMTPAVLVKPSARRAATVAGGSSMPLRSSARPAGGRLGHDLEELGVALADAGHVWLEPGGEGGPRPGSP